MKKYLYFYIIAIIMLVNDALFNWVGMLTGFSPWRQAIWLVAMIIMFIILKKYKSSIPSIRKTFKQYTTLFALIVLLSFATLMMGGISMTRVLMSIIEYLYGLPFIVFPFICTQCGWTRESFDRFFIWLGVFLSAGFIVDYASGGVFTMAFAALVSNTFDEFQFEYGRYNFLSTSNSILTLTLGLALLCSFNSYISTRKRLKKMLLLLASVFIVFGSVFCGARQTLAGVLIVEAFGLLSIMIKSRRGLVAVFLFFIVFLGLLPTMQGVLSENKGFSERYTSDAIKEDDRTATWREGFNYCFVNTTPKRLLIGEGIGFTMTAHAASHDLKGKHYENSLLARISECGVIVGSLTLLLPVFYIVFFRKKRKINMVYYGVVLMYLFISLVSPNGLGNQTQMALYILLGLFFVDSKRERYIFKGDSIISVNNR